MARAKSSADLTANNLIYLYRLLSRELGCGRQTFLPAVEEALASDQMTAADLGFDSTRDLLEALEAFVKLTIFKGGRIYATIIAQPAWDEALTAFEAAGGKKAVGGSSGKPWKRKKADKTLKPVRPKRAKRPEPEPEPVPVKESETEPELEIKADGKPSTGLQLESALKLDSEPAAEPEAASALEAESASSLGAPSRPAASNGSDALFDSDTPSDADAPSVALDAGTGPERSAGREATAPGLDETASEDPKPAISLTVVYDPYNGIDRETTIQSHPVAPAPSPARPEATSCAGSVPAEEPAQLDALPHAVEAPARVPSSAPAQSSVAAPAEPETALEAVPVVKSPLPSPEVLASYPDDFSNEVYLPSERIADLCEVLPYGTDVFALLAEDYKRARALELVSGTRARIVFPLRIQHAHSIEPIKVTLKKRSGVGLQWELSVIE